MATWDSLFPDVLPDAVAAPTPLVRRALIKAARKFCRRTFAWRPWIACAAGVAPSYTFTLPAASQMLRIERVTVDGKPVEVKPSWLPDRDPVTHAEEEEPAAIASNDLVTFVITGGAVTGTVQAQVSLMPTLAAATIDDFLASRYGEAIAHGAKDILLRHTGAPWRDLDAARNEAGAFEMAIAEASVDVFRGHTRSTPRARIHWF